MITAILEDKKGFRRSYNLAKFKFEINIPGTPELKVINKNEVSVDSLRPKGIKFKFYKWLQENKVALYREA